jgi:hypothetical protein
MKWLVFTLLCFILTPYAAELAYVQRGYSAIGGEMFVPVLPLIGYTLAPIFKEWRGLND